MQTQIETRIQARAHVDLHSKVDLEVTPKVNPQVNQAPLCWWVLSPSRFVTSALNGKTYCACSSGCALIGPWLIRVCTLRGYELEVCERRDRLVVETHILNE